MVGMLQIITYLLCVYLIFKGIEIFQIALMSGTDSKTRQLVGFIVGFVMIGISIVAAYVFVGWIDSQASSVGNSMPNVPR